MYWKYWNSIFHCNQVKKWNWVIALKKNLIVFLINAGDMRMQYVGKRKVAIKYIDSSTLWFRPGSCQKTALF